MILAYPSMLEQEVMPLVSSRNIEITTLNVLVNEFSLKKTLIVRVKQFVRV